MSITTEERVGTPSSARLRNREGEPKVGEAPHPPPGATTSGAGGPTSATSVGQPTNYGDGSTCEAKRCALQTATTAPTPTPEPFTYGLEPITHNDPILPEAQRRWAARPLTERLEPIRLARHWIATHPEAFTAAISTDLARSEADTLIAEVLPLLDAMRFLERNARRLLAPQRLGQKGRPLWLTGIASEVQRDPLGHVLIIAPSNFPLFLAGVQAVQALVAGNAVTWKPGTGGGPVALLLAHALREAGLPRGVLRVTDESVEAAQTALAEHPDKVVFTGSFTTGRRVLKTLAHTVTPAVMELSGADAVVVLPSARLPLVARAVAFGLRLNGAEVCMSPRRLIATPETLQTLRPLLQAELAKVPAVALKPGTATLLSTLLEDAISAGATPQTFPTQNSRLNGTLPQITPVRPTSNLTTSPLTPEQNPDPGTPRTHTRPILLDHATPQMAITRTDLFAPVLSLIEAPTVLHFPDAVNDCPYALTATIFGSEPEARALAAQLRVGTVLINDLIAPTVDPRVPFAGRGSSGFGATRGAEGLLEMTAPKTVLVRRRGSTRHYDPLGPKDAPLLAALLGALHGGTLRDRWRSLQNVIAEGRKRGKHPNHT